jgi:hypothetical protein
MLCGVAWELARAECSKLTHSTRPTTKQLHFFERLGWAGLGWAGLAWKH